LVAILLLGAAGEDPLLKAAERCEQAPALSPFELADVAVVHLPSGVAPPPCVRRLLTTGPRAHKVLSRLLSHQDPRVGGRAAELLGLLGRPESADALIAALPSAGPSVEDPAHRKVATLIRALGRIGGDTAARALTQRVEQGGEWSALGVADALAATDAPIAVRGLAVCAADACAGAWTKVAGLDELQHDPPPSPLVSRCADVATCWRSIATDGTEPERALAILWLGRLLPTTSDVAEPLLDALRDPSAVVRRQAREVLLKRCRGSCAEAAKAHVDSPRLAPAERVWLRLVLLRAAQ
jgi:HEAT repeat protein